MLLFISKAMTSQHVLALTLWNIDNPRAPRQDITSAVELLLEYHYCGLISPNSLSELKDFFVANGLQQCVVEIDAFMKSKGKSGHASAGTYELEQENRACRGKLSLTSCVYGHSQPGSNGLSGSLA
jgi:hypothetical protein